MNPDWTRPYILADDFTGGCDAALPFLSCCPEVSVYPHLPPISREGALAVSCTSSRALPATEAVDRVRLKVNEASNGEFRLLMKKIDSTLRGPVAEETEAVMAASDYERIIFCPAFPSQGRTIRDGILRIDGTPLSKSALFEGGGALQLPDRPAEILQKNFHVSEVGLETVRLGTASLIRAVLESPSGSAICIDAESEADLDSIASAIWTQQNWLPVGAAGLARALARRFPVSRACHPPPTTLSGPPVFLIGSLNPRSRAQEEKIAAIGEVRLWLAKREMIRNASSGHSAHPGELGASIGDALRKDDLSAAIVATEPPDESSTLSDDSAPMMAAWLARLGLECCTRGEAGGLLCCGGDIAQAVIEASGASSLRLEAELMPGIARCRLAGGQFDGLPLVTKPGGFGDDDALIRILQLWTTPPH